MKVVMSAGSEIQPAVITTFALFDLMGQTQKCHAPPAVVESSRLIDTANPHNSATFVENRSFQTVPKQEGAMNTQNRRHDIYSSQVYRCASLLNEFKP